MQIAATLLLVVVGWCCSAAEHAIDAAVVWGRMLAPWQQGFSRSAVSACAAAGPGAASTA